MIVLFLLLHMIISHAQGKPLENKDHQRMMVDPMFMIVQSVRSFLTAVTTIAVIPIVT